MPTSQPAPRTTSFPGANLLHAAAAKLRGWAGRLVVTVDSTDDMSNPWQLYRLTRGLTRETDPVRAAAGHELSSELGR